MIWGDGITDSADKTSSLSRARSNTGPALRPRVPRRRDGAVEDRARLRHLAAEGLLGALSTQERRRLLPAAFEVAYPIVYDVITRRVARNRGHNACGHGPHQMEDTCLDGFQDDLETVIDHLMSATAPISDLEGWLARSAQKTAVDGHRRRQGAPAGEPRPLLATDPAEVLQARIGDLAGPAVLALQTQLRRGDDPTLAVIEVLTTLFLGGAGEIDHGPDRERVSTLLADPAALSVLVQHVLGIVRGTG
ncbi:hypothetical protein [Actinoplanes derwentensis]|uniref:Uncharacterized protein n=1 Tax=Actinoplanes derwentensis TaxID=113562 RepID=A0A1H2DEJ1_9ACTN|nr:hypothetical protein [Actinoplanes derwentensis]GID84761.1 hypothetical protein Ade03nite_36850 [Actinoplanes derwentensis]SDT81153.1 hypothetical protein SAMN04489716_9517 [Actinoplanes derwentensis]